MSDTAVKICGLTEPAHIQAAYEAGADYVGFVFYPRSPRHIDVDRLKVIASVFPSDQKAVGVFVDPDDALLETVLSHLSLAMIQLHGSETLERVHALRYLNIPLMKGFAVSSEDDLESVSDYEEVADWLLFDARVADSPLPGGTGKTFDWLLLKNKHFRKPWMLSGGLNIDNVTQAIETAGPNAVDVSSGVENSPGKKNTEKIKNFIKKVKTNG